LTRKPKTLLRKLNVFARLWCWACSFSILVFPLFSAADAQAPATSFGQSGCNEQIKKKREAGNLEPIAAQIYLRTMPACEATAKELVELFELFHGKDGLVAAVVKTHREIDEMVNELKAKSEAARINNAEAHAAIQTLVSKMRAKKADLSKITESLEKANQIIEAAPKRISMLKEPMGAAIHTLQKSIRERPGTIQTLENAVQANEKLAQRNPSNRIILTQINDFKLAIAKQKEFLQKDKNALIQINAAMADSNKDERAYQGAKKDLEKITQGIRVADRRIQINDKESFAKLPVAEQQSVKQVLQQAGVAIPGEPPPEQLTRNIKPEAPGAKPAEATAATPPKRVEQTDADKEEAAFMGQRKSSLWDPQADAARRYLLTKGHTLQEIADGKINPKVFEGTDFTEQTLRRAQAAMREDLTDRLRIVASEGLQRESFGSLRGVLGNFEEAQGKIAGLRGVTTVGSYEWSGGWVPHLLPETKMHPDDVAKFNAAAKPYNEAMVSLRKTDPAAYLYATEVLRMPGVLEEQKVNFNPTMSTHVPVFSGSWAGGSANQIVDGVAGGTMGLIRLMGEKEGDVVRARDDGLLRIATERLGRDESAFLNAYGDHQVAQMRNISYKANGQFETTGVLDTIDLWRQTGGQDRALHGLLKSTTGYDYSSGAYSIDEQIVRHTQSRERFEAALARDISEFMPNNTGGHTMDGFSIPNELSPEQARLAAEQARASYIARERERYYEEASNTIRRHSTYAGEVSAHMPGSSAKLLEMTKIDPGYSFGSVWHGNNRWQRQEREEFVGDMAISIPSGFILQDVVAGREASKATDLAVAAKTYSFSHELFDDAAEARKSADLNSGLTVMGGALHLTPFTSFGGVVYKHIGNVNALRFTDNAVVAAGKALEHAPEAAPLVDNVAGAVVRVAENAPEPAPIIDDVARLAGNVAKNAPEPVPHGAPPPEAPNQPYGPKEPRSRSPERPGPGDFDPPEAAPLVDDVAGAVVRVAENAQTPASLVDDVARVAVRALDNAPPEPVPHSAPRPAAQEQPPGPKGPLSRSPERPEPGDFDPPAAPRRNPVLAERDPVPPAPQLAPASAPIVPARVAGGPQPIAAASRNADELGQAASRGITISREAAEAVGENSAKVARTADPGMAADASRTAASATRPSLRTIIANKVGAIFGRQAEQAPSKMAALTQETSSGSRPLAHSADVVARSAEPTPALAAPSVPVKAAEVAAPAPLTKAEANLAARTSHGAAEVVRRIEDLAGIGRRPAASNAEAAAKAASHAVDEVPEAVAQAVAKNADTAAEEGAKAVTKTIDGAGAIDDAAQTGSQVARATADLPVSAEAGAQAIRQADTLANEAPVVAGKNSFMGEMAKWTSKEHFFSRATAAIAELERIKALKKTDPDLFSRTAKIMGMSDVALERKLAKTSKFFQSRLVERFAMSERLMENFAEGVQKGEILPDEIPALTRSLAREAQVNSWIARPKIVSLERNLRLSMEEALSSGNTSRLENLLGSTKLPRELTERVKKALLEGRLVDQVKEGVPIVARSLAEEAVLLEHAPVIGRMGTENLKLIFTNPLGLAAGVGSRYIQSPFVRLYQWSRGYPKGVSKSFTSMATEARLGLIASGGRKNLAEDVASQMARLMEAKKMPNGELATPEDLERALVQVGFSSEAVKAMRTQIERDFEFFSRTISDPRKELGYWAYAVEHGGLKENYAKLLRAGSRVEQPEVTRLVLNMEAANPLDHAGYDAATKTGTRSVHQKISRVRQQLEAMLSKHPDAPRVLVGTAEELKVHRVESVFDNLSKDVGGSAHSSFMTDESGKRVPVIFVQLHDGIATTGQLANRAVIDHEVVHAISFWMEQNLSPWQRKLASAGTDAERADLQKKLLEASARSINIRRESRKGVLTRIAEYNDVDSNRILDSAEKKFMEEMVAKECGSTVNCAQAQAKAKSPAFIAAKKKAALKQLAIARRDGIESALAAIGMKSERVDTFPIDEVLAHLAGGRSEFGQARAYTSQSTSHEAMLRGAIGIGLGKASLDRAAKMAEDVAGHVNAAEKALKDGGILKYDPETGKASISLGPKAGVAFDVSLPQGLTAEQARVRMNEVLGYMRTEFNASTEKSRSYLAKEMGRLRDRIASNKLGKTTAADYAAARPTIFRGKPIYNSVTLKTSSAISRAVAFAEANASEEQKLLPNRLAKAATTQERFSLLSAAEDSLARQVVKAREEAKLNPGRAAEASAAALEKRHAAIVAQMLGEQAARRNEIGSSAGKQSGVVRSFVKNLSKDTFERYQFSHFEGRNFEQVMRDPVMRDQFQALKRRDFEQKRLAANDARGMLEAALTKWLPEVKGVDHAKKLGGDLLEAQAAASRSGGDANRASTLAQELRKRGWSEAQLQECWKQGICNPKLGAPVAEAPIAEASIAAKQVLFESEVQKAGSAISKDARSIAGKVGNPPRTYPEAKQRLVSQAEQLKLDQARLEAKVSAAPADQVARRHLAEVKEAQTALAGRQRELAANEKAWSAVAPISIGEQALQNRAHDAIVKFLRSDSAKALDEIDPKFASARISASEARVGDETAEQAASRMRAAEAKGMEALQGVASGLKNSDQQQQLAKLVQEFLKKSDPELGKSMGTADLSAAALGRASESSKKAFELTGSDELARGTAKTALKSDESVALAEALGIVKGQKSEKQISTAAVVETEAIRAQAKALGKRHERVLASSELGKEKIALNGLEPVPGLSAALKTELASSISVLESTPKAVGDLIEKIAAIAESPDDFETFRLAYVAAAKIKSESALIEKPITREKAWEAGVRRMLEESGYTKAELDVKNGILDRTLGCLSI